MPVYGFYVFDRHCNCTFYQSYAGKPPKPSINTLPHVFRSNTPIAPTTVSTALPPWERLTGGSGAEKERNEKEGRELDEREIAFAKNGLVFDEEAKLVYGIIFSLRNMVKKLSLREEDSFQSFSTSTYKLHYLQTATSTHLVLITAPMVESLRFLLRQIYAGPFTEYVIRNPLIERELGRGIDNDQFRDGVNKLVNGN